MNPFQIQIFIFIAIIIFYGANSFRQNGNIIPLKPGSPEKKYLKQKPFLHANEWYQDPFHENLTIEEFTDDIDCVHEDPYYSNPSPYSYYEQKCVQEQNKKQCEINNINILSYFYQKQIFSNIHVPNNTPVWCIFLLPPEKKSQCNSAKTNIEPSYLPLYLKFNSESIDLDKSGASDVEFIFSKNQITANIIKIENKTFFEISKIIQENSRSW
ncbi:hypothetical protein EDEG_04177 [Edhazardia aedis USNM 41457]|uniref:Transmembrane protein n=1 Tax=Edhazardia aedis (strain USNM 41457) TaxID=1003232 RepID=J9DBJ9_EDHAE|nr:hypothetical protein EDEG_04177 [Edhazardia aedis USNM 41457]|eukprot:EJW04869.1 hypothetical protein EDEG_04177 [Edhazardia aedis USNM 41457]